MSKLFGYLEKNSKEEDVTKERPPIVEQIKTYIEETKLKIEKKDKAFRIKAIITLVVYLYLTGFLATVLRFFGEVSAVGFREAPRPSLWPWDCIIALFHFKYSLMAILLTLLVAVVILIWWIRNHIGLGAYELEDRGGAKFKKQSMDATLGSARKMTAEEMMENFTVVNKEDFSSNNNPGTILFGKDVDTGDYVCEKKFGKDERPIRTSFTTGAAGSFKSSNFIIPMIMQLSRLGDNIIVNDPSGEINGATHKLLEKRGYDIKIFNTNNPNVSDGWNFIGAVGVNSLLSKKFARMIIDSFAGKGEGDSFWSEGMYVLLSALILFVNTTSVKTIEQIRYILNNIDVDEYPTLFEHLPDDHPAKMELNTFMTSPVKRNVQNNTALRLSVFNAAPISKICSTDGINIINDLADPNKKTAIFIMASDVESTFSFIPSLFMTACIVQLPEYAKVNFAEKTLQKPVHFIMDEFSNTGRIDEMPKYLSSTRKYNLVFHLIVQNLPQLYEIYNENEVSSMVGNSQYILIFGTRETITGEYFEKFCGKTTARSSMTQSTSVVTKTTDNFREGEQQRNLYFLDELLTMDSSRFILLKGGQHPLELKKVFWKDLFDYQYTESFDINNYEPEISGYKPAEHLKVSKKSTYSAENSSYQEEQSEQNDSYRQDNEKKKTPGKRKKDKRNKAISNSQAMSLYDKEYNSYYYLERPPVNVDEVYKKVDKNTNTETIVFKDNPNRNGEPRRAILLKFNIDGTTCTINGRVPDNRYEGVRTKLNLDEVETSCQLSKENSVLVGWKITYTSHDGKKIVKVRRKIPNTGKYVDENGVLSANYYFTLPESDCEISPIFEAGKGSERNKNREPQKAQNDTVLQTGVKL